MGKKIHKLIIYSLTILPITKIVACNTVSFKKPKNINDISKTLKLKQHSKDMIRNIKLPNKTKEHIENLHKNILKYKEITYKLIDMAKTNFDIIKARNKGIAAINKVINKKYKLSQVEKEKELKLLQIEKNKWLVNFHKPFNVIKYYKWLPKGETTAEVLKALVQHPDFPEKTPGVNRTFIVETHQKTKITTVNVIFKTKNNLQDSFVYYFAGFENIAKQRKPGIYWYDSSLNEYSYYVGDNKIFYKTRNNVVAIRYQRVLWGGDKVRWVGGWKKPWYWSIVDNSRYKVWNTEKSPGKKSSWWIAKWGNLPLKNN